MNRRMVDGLSSFLFPPTPCAASNLLREGHPPGRMEITGNTVVDSLRQVLDRIGTVRCCDPREPLVLVTVHRRESHGAPLEEICAALRGIVHTHPRARVLLPVHGNPAVRATVERSLGGCERIDLVPPMDYVSFVRAMASARVILTDSGGIQEEAPTLGVPVLVMRNRTERPEAVEAGTALLVGTRASSIADATLTLLDDPVAHDRMAGRANPFGDGSAGRRIVLFLLNALRGSPPHEASDGGLKGLESHAGR
jgi:UDP-N-acetylglucosamine 2-epimerase (non-hydrolysing)